MYVGRNEDWVGGALLPFFSNISEENNDYSDTLDFRRGWLGEVVSKRKSHKYAMEIIFITIN